MAEKVIRRFAPRIWAIAAAAWAAGSSTALAIAQRGTPAPGPQAASNDLRRDIGREGRNLQQAVDRAATIVRALDRQAQRLRTIVPSASSFLFIIHSDLSQASSGANGGSLSDRLAQVRMEASRGLKGMSQAPAPCGGAPLEKWDAAFKGADGLSRSVDEAMWTADLAAIDKERYDTAVVPILYELQKTYDPGAAPLARFRRQWDADLGRVADVLSRGAALKTLAGMFRESGNHPCGRAAADSPAGDFTAWPQGGTEGGREGPVSPGGAFSGGMPGRAEPGGKIVVGDVKAIIAEEKADDERRNLSKIPYYQMQWNPDAVENLGNSVGSVYKGFAQLENDTNPQIEPSTNRVICWFVSCKQEIGDPNHRPDIRYQTQQGSLFGPAGVVSPNSISQGVIRDCYFLSSIGAIAQRNPNFLKKMVRQNADGTYSVTFHSQPGNVVQVVKIDAKLPVHAASGAAYGAWRNDPADGLYPALLEKAYAKLHGSYADIGNDGWPDQALQELTGAPSQRIDASKLSNRQLAQQLSELNRKGEAIVVSTKSDLVDIILNPFYNNAENAFHGEVLAPNHAYWVERVNLKADGSGDVVLRNPWGYGDAHVVIPQDQLSQTLSWISANPIE